MVPITSLLLPVLLAAVLVFVSSSIIHMVLKYHRGEVRRVPQEDELLSAMRRMNLPPGDYGVPHAGSPEGMKKPEFIEKATRGPLVLMSVASGGPMNMGSNLLQWFVYSIVIGVFVAYVTGRVFGPGANYLDVFRLAGTTAFMSYALALPQHSIWFRRQWRTTFTSMFDGLIYGLLTAGAFGWLWPR